MTKKEREAIYNKYNGHCAYCGKKIEYKDMQVDHIIPQRRATAKAGRGRVSIDVIEDPSNLICSCRSCNHYKRAHSLETFRRYIEEIPMKLSRDNYIYKVGLRYNLIEEHPRKIKFYFEQMEDCRHEEISEERKGT